MSKIKEYEHLEKDDTNGAILNTDKESLKAYRIQKRKNSQIDNLNNEVNHLKNEMGEIKSLLKELVGK